MTTKFTAGYLYLTLLAERFHVAGMKMKMVQIEAQRTASTCRYAGAGD